MECVSAGPQADIYRSAEASPKLGGLQIRLNFELGDGVGTRQHRRLIVISRVVVDPIQEKVVVLNAIAVDSN